MGCKTLRAFTVDARAQCIFGIFALPGRSGSTIFPPPSIAYLDCMQGFQYPSCCCPETLRLHVSWNVVNYLVRVITSLPQIVAFEDLQFAKPIGFGSFGTVYLGRWRETTVAIKVLNPDALAFDMDDPSVRLQPEVSTEGEGRACGGGGVRMGGGGGWVGGRAVEGGDRREEGGREEGFRGGGVREARDRQVFNMNDPFIRLQPTICPALTV